MFRKTYYATHPKSIDGASNEELGEQYLIGDLFGENDFVWTTRISSES